jgi:hypothetical protein
MGDLQVLLKQSIAAAMVIMIGQCETKTYHPQKAIQAMVSAVETDLRKYAPRLPSQTRQATGRFL